MATPKKLPPLNTPRGVAVWPSLTVADTKFKPEGEYSVRLAFDPDDEPVKELITELERRLDVLWDEHVASLEAPKRKQFERQYEKAPVSAPELDKEGEETGRILINFKMLAGGVSKKTGKRWEQKPTILDAKGVKLKNPPDIYGGSVLRIGFETTAGPVPSAKKFYLSNRLLAVKVLELVTRGGYSTDALGLGDEEDGYEADDSEVSGASSGTASEAPGDDGSDAGDGDF